MDKEYAETRYQVELVMYDRLAHLTTTKTYYTDDFFDAVHVIEESQTRFHHIELFDSAMGRTLFNSSDLD